MKDFIDFLYQFSNLGFVCVCSILNNLYYHRGDEVFRLLKNGGNFSYNKEDMLSDFWTAFVQYFDDFIFSVNSIDMSKADIINKILTADFYEEKNREVRAKIYSYVSSQVAKQNKSIILKHLYLEDTFLNEDGEEVTNYIRIDDVNGLANSNLINDNIESLALYNKFVKAVNKAKMTDKGKKNTIDILGLRYKGFTYAEIATELNIHISTAIRYGKTTEDIGRTIR